MFSNRHWNLMENIICIIYNRISVCWMFSSTHTKSHLLSSTFLMSQTKNLPVSYTLSCIHFHLLRVFDIFPCRCTHTHTYQDQLAINCSRIVHNDFTCQVWSYCVKLHTAECNGHWEFQVISDKWPRLGVDQQTWGLSDLSLHQQTLLQPLGLSAGSCTLLTRSYCIPTPSACFSSSLSFLIPNRSQRCLIGRAVQKLTILPKDVNF